MRQGFDEVEEAGLAAAFLRGLDDQPGGGVPGRDGVGGGDPEHDRGGGVVGGEDDVGADRGFDLVQQLGPVDQIDDVVGVGWSCGAPSGSGCGVEDAAGEAGADGGVGLAGGEGAGGDVVGDGSRSWSRTVCSSTRPPPTSWPRATAAENRVWLRVPGWAIADAGGLAGQRGRGVAGRQRNRRPGRWRPAVRVAGRAAGGGGMRWGLLSRWASQAGSSAQGS